jgi:release factor glutamine methyltransferase
VDFERSCKPQLQAASLLDIGTGSGCIPIALKKKLPAVNIHALDVSEAALNVAKRNAELLEAPVNFYRVNILDENEWRKLPSFDIIVSNPPYIKQTEQNEMQQNVLQCEPHLALFVPDDDALIFYKAIAKFGLQKLNANGLLFFEINEAHGSEVAALLMTYGYTEIELRKDLQGKERMIKLY